MRVCFKSGTFMSQGIRVPNSDFVRVCFTKFRVSARVNASLMQRIVILALQAISRQYGHAIALTSANQSGTPSTLSVHEFSSLWDEVCVCSCPTALCVSIGKSTFSQLCDNPSSLTVCAYL